MTVLEYLTATGGYNFVDFLWYV